MDKKIVKIEVVAKRHLIEIDNSAKARVISILYCLGYCPWDLGYSALLDEGLRLRSVGHGWLDIEDQLYLKMVN